MSLFISNISNSGKVVIPMFWCRTKQLVLPTNFAFAASGNTQHLDTSRSRAKLCWTLWVGWLLAAILMRRHHMTLNLFSESITRKHIWCVCQALQLRVPNWKFCSFALEHCIIFYITPLTNVSSSITQVSSNLFASVIPPYSTTLLSSVVLKEKLPKLVEENGCSSLGHREVNVWSNEEEYAL